METNLTAGYNADYARRYGIVEALLIDTIVFWSRHSRRHDGFCWFTSDEFEVKTAVKSGAMKRAIDKLVDQGIIEIKNTYIIGTQKKCRHFKIIKTPESEISEIAESDYAETIQSEPAETIQSVNSSNRNTTSLSKDKGETPVNENQLEPKAKYGNNEINELFEYWEQIIGYKIQSKTAKNRFACNNLLKKYNSDGVKRLIDGTRLSTNDPYAPRIADFIQLQSKLNELMAWGKKQTNRGNVKI